MFSRPCRFHHPACSALLCGLLACVKRVVGSLRVFSSLCCMEAAPGSPCAASPASEPALPAGLHHRALTLSPRRRRRRRRHASTSPRAQVPRPHMILSSDAVRGESREPAERGLLDASEARAGTRAPTVSVAVPRSRSGPGPNGSLSVSRRPGSGSWQAPA